MYNGGISDLAVTHIFIFKKLSARDFEILKKFPRVCTGKGAKYLLFLTIALQGKIFGILCLDSHIYLDYIYFLGGFLFSNCPAGKIFFGYKQSSLAFLIVFSQERREKIQPGKKFGTFLRRILPSLEKKKHCQTLPSLVKFFLPKLASLAKNCLRVARFARQKLSARLASLAVFAHMCARCEA
jgi:hypothetical protein